MLRLGHVQNFHDHACAGFPLVLARPAPSARPEQGGQDDDEEDDQDHGGH
jgi:hypothetical protein